MLEQAVPNTNQAGRDYCQMKGGSNRRHCLIKWDLTNGPPASDVKQACLKIEMLDPSASVYKASKVLRDWSELQATWLKATTATSWEVPGAWGPNDSARTVDATIPANSTGFITIPLPTALVKDWLDDPSNNHGLVFGNDASYDGTSFATNESASGGALLAIVK